jgi:hypothetical protein
VVSITFPSQDSAIQTRTHHQTRFDEECAGDWKTIAQPESSAISQARSGRSQVMVSTPFSRRRFALG